jgi:hypothetical protein
MRFTSSESWALFHLRITAESDPGALARVIERFQNLNVMPRKVVAEWATTEALHIEVEVAGPTEATVRLHRSPEI